MGLLIFGGSVPLHLPVLVFFSLVRQKFGGGAIIKIRIKRDNSI